MSIVMDMNTRRPVSSLSLSDQILHLTFHSLNHHVLSSHRLFHLPRFHLTLRIRRKNPIIQTPLVQKGFQWSAHHALLLVRYGSFRNSKSHGVRFHENSDPHQLSCHAGAKNGRKAGALRWNFGLFHRPISNDRQGWKQTG